jgi:hypothetical protein
MPAACLRSLLVRRLRRGALWLLLFTPKTDNEEGNDTEEQQ